MFPAIMRAQRYSSEVSQVEPPASFGAIPVKDKDEFWREYIRVETDRFILAALILVLHFVHAPDSWVLPLIGGLVMSIQNQRFNRRQK